MDHQEIRRLRTGLKRSNLTSRLIEADSELYRPRTLLALRRATKKK
jgi:hypothetical protein